MAVGWSLQPEVNIASFEQNRQKANIQNQIYCDSDGEFGHGYVNGDCEAYGTDR